MSYVVKLFLVIVLSFVLCILLYIPEYYGDRVLCEDQNSLEEIEKIKAQEKLLEHRNDLTPPNLRSKSSSEDIHLQYQLDNNHFERSPRRKSETDDTIKPKKRISIKYTSLDTGEMVMQSDEEKVSTIIRPAIL